MTVHRRSQHFFLTDRKNVQQYKLHTFAEASIYFSNGLSGNYSNVEINFAWKTSWFGSIIN